MKISTKHFLPLICFCAPAALFSSPLTNPAPGKWHFTAGSEFGGGSYRSLSSHDSNESYESAIEGGLFLLSLNQSVGYGRWFYLQAVESGMLGFGTSLVDGFGDGQDERASKTSFIDTSIRSYFPLPLSRRNRISLIPSIGYTMHFLTAQAHETDYGDNPYAVSPRFIRYQSRLLSPTVGLALGMDVTPRFNFRFDMALEFPNYKGRARDGYDDAMSPWERFKMHRLGLHSRLDLSYQLNSHAHLAASVDHLHYGLVDRFSDETRPFIGYLDRFTYALGVQWAF